jgi:alpha-beta hydrolase superfamily lysophospholipase
MTSPTTRFSYPAKDGLKIAAYHWAAPGPARGIVQLTHGMGEHVLRYGELAGELNKAGFEVYGQDHRGHGATAQHESDLGRLGDDGWGGLVHDIDLLADRIGEEQPGRPLVLLGHSMGSFAVQQYLLDHSDRLAAAVLSGTALLDLLEPALDLDAPLELAMFNAAFAPARTDFDWLTRDEAQVDAYLADPRCGFGLDTPGAKAMFTAARAMADPDRLAGLRKDLPVYVTVGDMDPVNGQLALVRPLIQRYQDAGLTDVTFKSYPQARHEVFNETNRAEITADLVAWLDRVVPRR